MLELINGDADIQQQIANAQEQFALLADLHLVAIGGGCGAASLD